MNKWFVSIYLLAGTILYQGCSLFDKNDQEAKKVKILHEPPFDILTDSINESPGKASLYLKRAELLSQKNLSELAFPDYKKSWDLQPAEQTALLYTANLFMTGRDTEAIRLLQACIKMFPKNSEFPRRLSEAYLQSGKSSQALDQFNKIISADSNNFEAWYEKGILLSQLKDTANAIRSLEKAFALQPLQVVSIPLANLYAETKNIKALSLCNELIKNDTALELIDPLFIKGIYFANTNQRELALEQFENCINRDWKFTEAYIEKGIILFKDKNIDEALQTFTLAAKVSNTYPDAYYWMGRCYESIGKKEEARDNYGRALALDRNFTEAKESLKRLN